MIKPELLLSQKDNINNKTGIKGESANNIEDDNILNNNDDNLNQEKRKDFSIHIKSNYKSANYQYFNNNNCSSSNKSKDKDTKSKQTKYLIANNEILNHLIYFTNSSNKTGILSGSSSNAKSEPEYQ